MTPDTARPHAEKKRMSDHDADLSALLVGEGTQEELDLYSDFVIRNVRNSLVSAFEEPKPLSADEVYRGMPLFLTAVLELLDESEITEDEALQLTKGYVGVLADLTTRRSITNILNTTLDPDLLNAPGRHIRSAAIGIWQKEEETT